MDYGRGTTSGFTVTKSFVCVFILHIELSKPICGLLESYRVEKKIKLAEMCSFQSSVHVYDSGGKCIPGARLFLGWAGFPLPTGVSQ